MSAVEAAEEAARVVIAASKPKLTSLQERLAEVMSEELQRGPIKDELAALPLAARQDGVPMGRLGELYQHGGKTFVVRQGSLYEIPAPSADFKAALAACRSELTAVKDAVRTLRDGLAGLELSKVESGTVRDEVALLSLPFPRAKSTATSLIDALPATGFNPLPSPHRELVKGADGKLYVRTTTYRPSFPRGGLELRTAWPHTAPLHPHRVPPYYAVTSYEEVKNAPAALDAAADLLIKTYGLRASAQVLPLPEHAAPTPQVVADGFDAPIRR